MTSLRKEEEEGSGAVVQSKTREGRAECGRIRQGRAGQTRQRREEETKRSGE
jgi:hypothetical protein